MKKRSPLIPKYAYVPFVMEIVVCFCVYYLSRLFTQNAYHHDVSIALDGKIPFVSPFILPYVLAYAQWAGVLLLVSRQSRDVCYKIVTAELISKMISFGFFVFFPTAMERAPIEGSNIFDRLTGLIYSIDPADNLFPSVHCVDSWICMRATLKIKKVPAWANGLHIVFTLLVLASTVLVKQHLFVDIIGGVAVAELGFLLVKLLKAQRLMYKLVPKRWQ